MTHSKAQSKLLGYFIEPESKSFSGNDRAMSKGHKSQLKGDAIDQFEHQKADYIPIGI